MICRITSGLLFAYSRTTVSCTGTYIRFRTVSHWKISLAFKRQREADWQMKLNVATCHSMKVTRHQHHKQILLYYSLHNQSLENVQSAKYMYLGIIISHNMDWSQHISSSVGEMLDEFEWPSLEAQRDRSSLLLYHKIRCGAVSIEKASTWPLFIVWKLLCHNTVPNIVDTRHLVMPWRTLSFPELFPSGIIFLLRWSIPRPPRSLGHSSFSQKHSRFFFSKFKIALPNEHFQWRRFGQKTLKPRSPCMATLCYKVVILLL